VNGAQPQTPLLPWEGAYYASGFRSGLKLLVLGESQYVPEGQAWPNRPETYTLEVVQDFIKLDGRGSYTMDFAGRLHRILTGSDDPTERQVKEAWGRIAYANYIPEIVGYGAIARKRSEHWQDGHQRLPELLDDLEPDRVLVLGRATWLHILHGRWSTHGEGWSIGGKQRGLWEFDVGGKVALSSWIYHPSRSMDSIQMARDVLDALIKMDNVR